MPLIIFLSLSAPILAQFYTQLATGDILRAQSISDSRFIMVWIDTDIKCNIFDQDGNPEEVTPISFGLTDPVYNYMEIALIHSTRLAVAAAVENGANDDIVYCLVDLDPLAFVSCTELTSGSGSKVAMDIAVFSDSTAALFYINFGPNDMNAFVIDTDNSILVNKPAISTGVTYRIEVLEEGTLTYCYGFSGDMYCDFFDPSLNLDLGSRFQISGGLQNTNPYILVKEGTTDEFILSRDKEVSASNFQVQLRSVSRGDGTGSDLQVTDTGGNSIGYSKVAKLPNGNYFVVYHSFATTPDKIGGAIVSSDLSSQLQTFDISRAADGDVVQKWQEIIAFDDGRVGIPYTASSRDIYYHVLCFENTHCSDPTNLPVCDTNECIACTLDAECQTHPGYAKCMSTGQCVPLSIDMSIEVQDPYDPEVCEDAQFYITTTTDFTGIEFEVVVESVAGDPTTISDINTYFDGLGSVEGELPLSKSYLELNVDYTFKFSYELEEVQASTYTINPLDHLSANIPSTTISITKNQAIYEQIQIRNCLPDKSISHNWDQTSVDPLFSIDPWTSNDGSTIEIDACELKANSQYEYQYQLFYDEDVASIFTLDITIEVEEWEFEIEISGDSSTAANEDLVLTTEVTSSCSIPSDTVEYKWLCEVQNGGDGDFNDCEDPSDLFGGYSISADTLTLTTEYLDSEDILRITVMARLGDDVQSSEHIVQVSSYLVLDLIDEDASCTFKLGAEIDDSESEYSYQYNWSLSNSLEDSDLEEQVVDFLAKQTTAQIIFPAYLIEVGSTYSFEVSYTNFKSNQFSDIFSIVASSELPSTTFLGGDNQQIPIFIDFDIRSLSPCMPGNVIQTWTQVSGPTLDLEDYTFDDQKNIISIPKCTFDPEKDYVFRYTLTSSSTEAETESEITLATLSQNYRMWIEGGDQSHPESDLLELEAVMFTEGGCPYVGDATLSYEWECQVAQTRTDDFSACGDSDGLFGVELVDTHLTVPTEYFEAGNVLEIKVTVLEDSISGQEYVSRIMITDTNIFGISVGCESDLSCFVFSPQKEYRFNAQVSYAGLSQIESYWAIEPLFPTSSFIDKFRTIPLETTLDRENFNYEDVLIGFNVKNETHRSSIEYSIPFNFAPHQGDITASHERGLVLVQIFNFEASSWTDENLPLFYEFSYGKKTDSFKDYRSISLKSQTNSVSSILTLNSLSIAETPVNVRVDVYDIYEAKNYATVEVGLEYKELSTSEALEQLNQTLALIADFEDVEQQFQQLSLLSFHFSGVDYKILDEGKSGENCSCSGNGVCDEETETCECENGYTSKYCEVTSGQFTALEELKLDMMNLVQDSVDVVKDREKPVEIIADLTENIVLNTDQTIKKGKEILDSVIDTSNSTSIPSSDVSEKSSDILDNLISYAGETDCEATSDFTASLEADMEAYLGKLAKGLTSQHLTNEDPVILNEDQFSIYSQKLTECSIILQQLVMDSISPQLRISQKSLGQKLNCTKELLVSYFSFSEGIFNCERSGQDIISAADQKTILLLQIQDLVTGEDLSSNYKVEIKNPESFEGCENGCEASTTDESICICDSDASIFDIGGQIERVFSQSNLGLIFNTPISEWTVVDSVQFWSILGLGITLAGCGALIHFKLKDLCMVGTLVAKGEKISILQALKVLFVLNHPFLNAFFINSIQPSKLCRLGLFYCRMMMMLCVVSILGPNSGLTFGRRVLNINISLDIYILIIPFITFVPIEALLRVLLAQDHKKQSPSRRRLIYFLKFLRGVGIFLTVALTAVCIYGIIAIGEGSSSDDNKELLGLLGRTIAQDWIMTPLILILITLILQEENSTKILALKDKNENGKIQNSLSKSGTNPNKQVKKNQILPLNITSEENPKPLMTTEADIKGLISSHTEGNNLEVEEEEEEEEEKINLEQSSQNIPLSAKGSSNVKTKSLLLEKEGSEQQQLKEKDQSKLKQIIGTIHLNDLECDKDDEENKEQFNWKKQLGVSSEKRLIPQSKELEDK